ncbi:MAG: sodium:solute symporter family protein [Vicinamibacteraceae bacterium]|nr:sodium:solute symporter family protein [Vicinamibacteraceae bacterium]
MSAALALLVVYSIALTLFGLWVARLVRGSGDFFVAGRQLTWPLVMVSMLASNIGAGSTVGAAGLAYADGIGAWWWNGSAAIGSLALAFVIGPRIWRLASRHGFYTAGDFLEFRYGRATRGLVALLIWFGTLAILAGQLIAGAAILEVVAGLPKWAGALLGGLVMTIYFMAGGMLSSVWVNVVQLAVLLTGFAVAVPMVVAGVGGLDALTSAARLPPTFGDFWHSSRPGSGWTLVALLGPAFIVSPGLVQKAYGARSARAVTWGVAANAAALALFAFFPVLLGMSARVAHPDIASPNLVLPTVLLRELPVWIGALTLAAVFSAEVSTCDAILFMLSTSLSKDLYKRFVKPEATDHELLRMARGAALAGGALGVALATVLPTVIGALSIFYALLGVSLFVPVVVGLLTRRGGQIEALASIGAGTATLLAVHLATGGKGVGLLSPNLAGLAAAALGFGLLWLARWPARR